jgi:MFS family permease
MFRALRNPSFRTYWIGNLVSQMGSWVQMVARPWLVYEITHSTAALGMIAFLGAIPLLFLSLLGGVLADRTDRKRLIVVTQMLYMLLAFVLAALVWLKLVQVWQVALLSLLGGIVTAYDMPARQAMVTDMVGRDDLMNAIALNSAAFNFARILGPAVAGFLVEWSGMGWCFFLNGLSFIAVIIPLWRLQFEQHPPQRDVNVWLSLKEGLAYIGSRRQVLAIMSIVSVASLFALPYGTLMPAFAKEVFGTNAAGMGTLFSANGVGALIGALILARMEGDVRRSTMVTTAAMMLGLSLIAFSYSRTIPVACCFLAMIGLCAVSQNATTNTLIQIIVPDRLRGRVMSAYMMIFQGIMPFGNLQAGLLADRWGSPVTVRIGGAIAFLYAASLALRIFMTGEQWETEEQEEEPGIITALETR